MQSYVELSTLVLHHVSNLFANVTFGVITFLMYYFSFRTHLNNPLRYKTNPFILITQIKMSIHAKVK